MFLTVSVIGRFAEYMITIGKVYVIISSPFKQELYRSIHLMLDNRVLTDS